MQLQPVQGPVFYYKTECKEDLNITEEREAAHLSAVYSDKIKEQTEKPSAAECHSKHDE